MTMLDGSRDESLLPVVPYEEGYIIVYTGVRGSTKTCQLARIAMWSLAVLHRPTYSNFPIGGKINGRYYEAEPLPDNVFVTYAKDIPPRSVLIVDELQEFFDRQDWASVQSKFGQSLFAQIRKLNISIVGALQFFHYLNARIAIQVDLLAKCSDLEFTPWGRDHGVGKGVEAKVEYFDLSGCFSPERKSARNQAHPHMISGEPYKTEAVYTKAFWEYFDSHKLTSLEQRFKKFYIEKTVQKVGSNVGQGVGANSELRDYLADVFYQAAQDGVEELKSSQVMDMVQRDGFESNYTEIGDLLRRMGIAKRHKRTATGQGYYYIVTPSVE